MEIPFLTQVSLGDASAVEKILSTNFHQAMNPNAADGDGRSALTIAIEDGNIEMVQLLLKYEVELGDSLLHAVNVEFIEGVRAICESAVVAKEFGTDHVNRFAGGSNFPPSMTPLILAGKRNNSEIVQILLQYGAKMPNLEEVTSQCPDSFSASLARICWYKAITSDSYLILACADPIKEAFHLSHEIARASSRWSQMKPELDVLYENLILFVTKLLNLAENNTEIAAVLGETRDKDHQGNSRRLPYRLQLALRLNFKQFVAHPSLQEYLLSDWYLGWTNWHRVSSFKFAFLSLLIMICFPLLSVMYILIPLAVFVTFMETPYIRFLMNTASRIFFLGILIISTLTTSVFFDVATSPFFYTSELAAFLSYKGPPPSTLTVVIYTWIFGILWQQLKLVWRQGFKSYWKNRWNWVDSVQLLLYIIYVVMNTIAYIQALNIAPDYIYRPTVSPTDTTNIVETITDIIYWNDSFTMFTTPLLTTDPKLTTWAPDIKHVGGGGIFNMYPGLLSASYRDQDRLSWNSWDPLLLAEATFALANVFSFLGIMRSMVILGFVGPLQVSLGGMLLDILRFLLLFSLVWISFAVGFTQLYRTFEILEIEICTRKPEFECLPPSFDTFSSSLNTLFWSLFGQIDMESVEIASNIPGVNHHLHMTEFVGYGMYTVYLVVAVVVLLNVLIAMMSTTYGRIEQNAETEWKVARTSLMTQYMCGNVGTLPPPFNLIPSINYIIYISKKLYHLLRSKASDSVPEKEQKKMDMGHQQYQALIRTLTARYVRTNQAEIARKKQKDQIAEELNDLKRIVERMGNGLMEIKV